MDDFHWIEKGLVLSIHKIQLSRFGGGAGLRDETLLESALAKPINYYTFQKESHQHVLLPYLAAKYAIGVIKSPR